MTGAPPVGIDLGTTNSVIAYVGDEGRPVIILTSENRPTMPSVVAFPKPDERIVGEAAKEYLATGLCPVAAFFKQEMGDPDFRVLAHGEEYSAVELSGFVLDSLLSDAAEFLRARPTQGVVTVPAYFRDAERSATVEAARRAGFEAFQTVNEPTAAAIAYGLRAGDEARKVLVYDLGGGTFDVTVLSFGDESRVLASNGDYALGGKNWDERLFEHLSVAFQDEFGIDPLDHAEDRMVLQEQIEGAKVRLSVATEARLSVRASDRHGTYQVTRREFEDMTRDLLSRTIALLEDVLAELSLVPGEIDMVLPVGGSTRMPMVREALEARFPGAVNTSLNPDEAVALGAGLLARQRADEIPVVSFPRQAAGPAQAIASGVRIRDVTTHSLGMIAVSGDGGRYVNSLILRRNREIPCRSVRSYRHRFDGAGGLMEIFLTQGEAEDPQEVSHLGCYAVTGLPGAEPGGVQEVEVAYEYDESAIVQVQARVAGQADWTNVERQPLPADVPGRFLEDPGAAVAGPELTAYIIIDVSGSMSGTPLKEAQSAARSFIGAMNLGPTTVGVIAVSDRVEVLLPASSDAAAIEQAIDRLTAGLTGYTNQADPFQDLLGLLKDVDGVKVGVILADGIWSDQAAAMRRARSCHAAGIEIAGIGFGSADKRFLQSISSTDDLSILTTQDGLTQAFLTIAQELNQKTGIKTH